MHDDDGRYMVGAFREVTMKLLPVCAIFAVLSSAAMAQEPAPLDPTGIDPAMFDDIYGPWIVSDESGDRNCRVLLKKDETIGGSEINVDPACEAVFPVMGEIAAWRLVEGWGIVFVDATRRTRVLFTTPDERYVARDEVDGIFTIMPEE